MTRPWLCLAGAALALAGGTAAADSARPRPLTTAAKAQAGPQIFLSADGATVYVIGELAEGSFFKFDAVMQDAPRVRRVYLASIGGFADEGRLIAALVRKHKLDTHVEYYCASACTMIFAGGRERVIGREAQLGFHQAVVVDKDGNARHVRRPTDRKLSPTQVVDMNGNDTLRLAYEQAGFEQAFITKALETSHSDMWNPPPAQLLAARVITRQAAANEVPLPPGGVTRASLQARLEQSPLWRQAAISHPGERRKAAEDAWLWANSGEALDEAVGSARINLIKALNPRLLTASDAQLDALLGFHARSARQRRETEYADCGNGPASMAASQRKAAAEREEDALLAGILASGPAVTMPTRERAIETFASDVMPVLAKAYRRGDADGATGLCRYSARIYEGIAALPGERRVNAFRAMLALPEWLHL